MESNNVVEPAKISNAVHAPEYAPVKENEQALMSLGLTAEHIAALPMVVNTGNAFLLLEVRNPSVLQKLQPDINSLQTLAEQYQLSGYCLFVREKEGADATAWLFGAPASMAEEASGHPGAGALACYLYDIAMIKKEVMVIRQVLSVSPETLQTLSVRLVLSSGKIQSWQSGTGDTPA